VISAQDSVLESASEDSNAINNDVQTMKKVVDEKPEKKKISPKKKCSMLKNQEDRSNCLKKVAAVKKCSEMNVKVGMKECLKKANPTKVPVRVQPADFDLNAILRNIDLIAIQCEGGEGYNRCTDMLELEPVGKVNLSDICGDDATYVEDLEGVPRGTYRVVILEYTGSSLLIEHHIVCGDGRVVVFTSYLSHVDERDVQKLIDRVFDASSIPGIPDAWDFLEAFIEAVGAEDYRFDDHDGDGIINAHDEDYDGPLFEGEEKWDHLEELVELLDGEEAEDGETESEEGEEESEDEDESEDDGSTDYHDPDGDLDSGGPGPWY